jgi:ABC-type antimicrobial peptide transport system permease subunit
MSYVVSQGTREIGIRVALGATQGTILGMVLRQGIALAATGLALGLAGAWALTRFMRSLLFGVSGTDGLTFLAVALLLALVAVVAVLIPATRASRIDPMTALSAV